MTVGRFIGGVAAVIWSREDEKYLLLRRSLDKDFAPGVWECVTGRVEQNESFVDALYREVNEELSARIQPVCILGTVHFYRGQPSPENELLGVVFGCEMPENAQIILSNEHDKLCWLTYDQAVDLLQASDPSTDWLRRVLHRAEMIRYLTPDALKQYYTENDFELG